MKDNEKQYIFLMLGKTGSGKTTALNNFINFEHLDDCFDGTNFDKMKILVPQKLGQITHIDDYKDK